MKSAAASPACSCAPTIPASCTGTRGPDSLTTLMASLYFEDLGQTLEQLGYQKAIVTENGSFELALAWPGGPQDFAPAGGAGLTLADIGEGHFPKCRWRPRAPCASWYSQPRRDRAAAQPVADVRVGDSFNKVDGEVRLHAGTIEVASMDGRAAPAASSSAGLHRGVLCVGRRAGSDIAGGEQPALVAALTAGLPVAAGCFC